MNLRRLHTAFCCSTLQDKMSQIAVRLYRGNKREFIDKTRSLFMLPELGELLMQLQWLLALGSIHIRFRSFLSTVYLSGCRTQGLPRELVRCFLQRVEYSEIKIFANSREKIFANSREKQEKMQYFWERGHQCIIDFM